MLLDSRQASTARRPVHDRVWYEMARFHLADRDDWAAVEMFEEKQPDGAPMPIAGPVKPIVKPASIDAIAANIATARKFHGMNEYAAGAVHARNSFELSLKKLCERKSISVRFKTDPRQLSSDDILNAVEAWLSDPSRQALLGVRFLASEFTTTHGGRIDTLRSIQAAAR
jgi:hypothetical protein